MAPSLKVPCVGCGALVTEMDGPTHEYVESAPGCWAEYGRLIDRLHTMFTYPEGLHLAADAYAVQHPGVQSRKAIQSVAVHLTALYLQLELELAPSVVNPIMGRVASDSGGLFWLEPPASRGAITVVDVNSVDDPQDIQRIVKDWAEEAYNAWSNHHPQIKRWTQKHLTS